MAHGDNPPLTKDALSRHEKALLESAIAKYRALPVKARDAFETHVHLQKLQRLNDESVRNGMRNGMKAVQKPYTRLGCKQNIATAL